MELIPQSILELGQAVTTAFIIWLIIKEILNRKVNGNGVSKLNAEQETKIAVLEEQLKSANKKLEKIESNDLCHLRVILDQHSKDLEEIKINIARISIKLEEVV